MTRRRRNKLRPMGPTQRCKNLPNTATKAELMARHKAKMMGKFFRNYDPGFRQTGTVVNHKGVL